MLADGRVVDSRVVAGTLNRLVGVPPLLLEVAQPTDREYAGQEMFAFFLSWLHCLPGPMLNRPTPQGLSGAWRHDSEWAVLAAEAGLRTSPYRMTSQAQTGGWSFSDDVLREEHVATVVVVGEEVIGGPGGAEVNQGCRRLAVLADTELLGVDLVEDQPGSWAFLQAVPQPELRVGSEPLLDALVKTLTDGKCT